jgi:putative membrane protein
MAISGHYRTVPVIWRSNFDSLQLFVMSYLEDPRVFFAGERTLFAWLRTGLALTAMGLAITRYQLFLSSFKHEDFTLVKSHASFYLGMAFVVLGWLSILLPTIQFRFFFKSLDPVELPPRYRTLSSVYVSGFLSLLIGLLIGFLIFE